MALVHIADETAFGKEFMQQIIDWIPGQFEPDEVFELDRLKEWALENGFVEDDEVEEIIDSLLHELRELVDVVDDYVSEYGIDDQSWTKDARAAIDRAEQRMKT